MTFEIVNASTIRDSFTLQHIRLVLLSKRSPTSLQLSRGQRHIEKQTVLRRLLEGLGFGSRLEAIASRLEAIATRVSLRSCI